ncbi:MAG: hypothetical protein AAFQ02_08210 [Bacteroidota bacterium]
MLAVWRTGQLATNSGSGVIEMIAVIIASGIVGCWESEWFCDG